MLLIHGLTQVDPGPNKFPFYSLYDFEASFDKLFDLCKVNVALKELSVDFLPYMYDLLREPDILLPPTFYLLKDILDLFRGKLELFEISKRSGS